MKEPRHKKCPGRVKASPGNWIENKSLFSFSPYILYAKLELVKYDLINKGRVASSQYEVGSQRPFIATRGVT